MKCSFRRQAETERNGFRPDEWHLSIGGRVSQRSVRRFLALKQAIDHSGSNGELYLVALNPDDAAFIITIARCPRPAYHLVPRFL